MKNSFFILLFIAFFCLPNEAEADLWGQDLPLLAQIVTNTLQTLHELERQTSILRDEMAGIRDRVNRMRTISELVQPTQWEQWRDPAEALRRLERIYYTLPKEYRSEKSDAMEEELSRAMSAISKVSGEAKATFLSGKELERKGAEASPGVAQKLTASGTGTLVAMAAQSQVIESHITSLLAQMLATANEKEARGLVSKGQGLSGVSENLSQKEFTFSSRALSIGGQQ
jgi:hypothetical protein